MVSQEGAASSGAVGDATHILLRISEFASSPRKRGSIFCTRQEPMDSRLRGNDDIKKSASRGGPVCTASAHSASCGDLLQSTRHPRLLLVFCPHD
jgi:hypothetical protein